MGKRQWPYQWAEVPGLGETLTRGRHLGLPVLTWGWADRAVLDTVRGLRRRGLRPGGQQPVAVLMFQHRIPARSTDFARLYLVERALPKRTATPAQLAGIEKALRARRTCRRDECGRVWERCVSTTSRMCGPCEEATDFWRNHALEHGHSWEVPA